MWWKSKIKWNNSLSGDHVWCTNWKKDWMGKVSSHLNNIVCISAKQFHFIKINIFSFLFSSWCIMEQLTTVKAMPELISSCISLILSQPLLSSYLNWAAANKPKLEANCCRCIASFQPFQALVHISSRHGFPYRPWRSHLRQFPFSKIISFILLFICVEIKDGSHLTIKTETSYLSD